MDYTVNLSKSYKIKNYAKSYKIKKMLQEAGDDGEDSAIGTDVKSDDGGDFQDTICWTIVSGFSIVLQGLNIHSEEYNINVYLILVSSFTIPSTRKASSFPCGFQNK